MLGFLLRSRQKKKGKNNVKIKIDDFWRKYYVSLQSYIVINRVKMYVLAAIGLKGRDRLLLMSPQGCPKMGCIGIDFCRELLEK